MELLTNTNFTATLFFLITAFIFFKFSKNRYLRFGTLAASLALLGFYLKDCICPIGAFQYIALINKDLFNGQYTYFILMFTLPVLFVFIAGRLFCGHVCPMGAFQEFLFKIGSKLKLNKVEVALKKFSFLIYFKYLFMIGIIIFSFVTLTAIFCTIEPFATLFNFSGTMLSVIILCFVIIFSLIISRPWCRIICPYGAFLGLISTLATCISNRTNLKFGAPKITKSCRHCGLCQKKCPVNAITKETIDSSECISCGECKKSCRFNSIT